MCNNEIILTGRVAARLAYECGSIGWTSIAGPHVGYEERKVVVNEVIWRVVRPTSAGLFIFLWVQASISVASLQRHTSLTIHLYSAIAYLIFTHNFIHHKMVDKF